jgi:predicted regulator of Ras-like GTPase activity (Roadblock/LC7/MglB family)
VKRLPETYAVDEEQSRLLHQALAGLRSLAEADAAFLSDYGGNLLASDGRNPDDPVVHTMSALAAGSYSATRELAGLVHETSFHSIVHQGEKTSLLLCGVGDDFVVLVVFGRQTTAGLVKLYVEKMVREIEPLLQSIARQSLEKMGGARNTFELAGGDVFKQG